MDLNKIYTKKKDIVSRKVADEYILVPISDDIADMDCLYTMNETGAYIWEQIDGKTSFNQIVKNIVNEFEVDEQKALTDATQFLNDIEAFLQ